MAKKEETKSKYKVKDGSAIKMQISTNKKDGVKEFKLYRPGDMVELSAAQAVSHQSEIEISEDQLAKAYKELAPAPVAVFEKEEKKEK